MHQVIFTTELLHSSSDSDQAVSSAASAVTQDSENDGCRRKDTVSRDDATGDGIIIENNADVTETAPAHIDAKTIERKPSKIIFKDYYVDSVRYLIVSFLVKYVCCS